MSFPGKTHVEVVDSTGKAKLRIFDVKYRLPVDQVISKWSDYRVPGRQPGLVLGPNISPI